MISNLQMMFTLIHWHITAKLGLLNLIEFEKNNWPPEERGSCRSLPTVLRSQSPLTTPLSFSSPSRLIFFSLSFNTRKPQTMTSQTELQINFPAPWYWTVSLWQDNAAQSGTSLLPPDPVMLFWKQSRLPVLSILWHYSPPLVIRRITRGGLSIFWGSSMNE